MPVFTWTNQLEEAAQLIADGESTHDEIAAKFGVHRVTVTTWCRQPEFKARVAELMEEFREATVHLAISRKEKRIASLNAHWLDMAKVIRERSADPDMAEVPGGTTGLIVRDYKTVGVGEAAKTMPVYSVDTGLLKEIREHEKQAAQELGQWVEKGTREISGPNGGPVQVQRQAPDLSKLSDADFNKLERMSRKLDVDDAPRVGPGKHRRGSRKKKTK